MKKKIYEYMTIVFAVMDQLGTLSKTMNDRNRSILIRTN